jgi:hypothetical protein
MAAHDCGGGCACDNCGGCIRYGGNRCKIFPRPAGASLAPEELEPLATKLAMDDQVTISVTDMTLAEVGLFVSSVLGDPVAVPAGDALRRTSIKLEDVPLSTVVERVGLVRMPG